MQKISKMYLPAQEEGRAVSQKALQLRARKISQFQLYGSFQ